MFDLFSDLVFEVGRILRRFFAATLTNHLFAVFLGRPDKHRPSPIHSGCCFGLFYYFTGYVRMNELAGVFVERNDKRQSDTTKTIVARLQKCHLPVIFL
ncbi:MAG: hypothetical protein WCQ90_09360 [Deltaproteobacteria bacterium]